MVNQIGDGFHHMSVMPDEVMQALAVKPDGTYVDGTLGGGGHAGLIFRRLTTGRIIGIDRDMDALQAARERLPGMIAVHGNFHDMPVILKERGIEKIDGILLDLGVSSHQLDTPERGFSYRFDGPLDMRMNRSQHEKTAADIINTYSQGELTRIFFQYGEERHAPRIARAICLAREGKPIETTNELVAIIESAIPVKVRYGDKHPAKRTFMALRIAVNNELAPLEKTFAEIIKNLNPGGRIVVITFHSLEDRIVKHTFKKLANPCDCPRDIPYCACGKEPQIRIITRNPVLPSAEEIEKNNRAHSAKLRAAERI
jgi:16S rRNA (cytosine1402-N4)-methyltransferase